MMCHSLRCCVDVVILGVTFGSHKHLETHRKIESQISWINHSYISYIFSTPQSDMTNDFDTGFAEVLSMT